MEVHGRVGLGVVRNQARLRQRLKTRVTLQDRDEALLDPGDEFGFAVGTRL
jgi:hypothetical protein